MIAAKKGKPSVTHWERIAVIDGRSVLRFRPETGRTHQLRIHSLAGLNIPAIGRSHIRHRQRCSAYNAACRNTNHAPRQQTRYCRIGPDPG